MDRRVRAFIGSLEKKCIENNVELLLVKDKSVKYIVDDIESPACTGYFDTDSHGDGSNKPVLACAIGDKSSRYISTLVHESCHMDQWLEQAAIWENQESCGVLDLWLGGEQVKGIKKHLAAVRDLERDCERRTIKKIIQYDLPINVEDYAQKANAYIHLYNYIGITRRWPEKTFEAEKFYNGFSKRIREKAYYNELSPKLLKLFKRHDPDNAIEI